MRAATAIAGRWALWTVCAAGCAGGWPGAKGPRPAGPPAIAADTEQGWRALADGRSERAGPYFLRALGAGGRRRDLLADFGLATVAFEQGDGALALEHYTLLIEAAARGEGGDWGALLAPVAIARADALLEEVPEGAVVAGRWQERLGAVPPGALSWEARIELAQADARIARRRGDPRLLEERARQAGCARSLFLAGTIGRLPHLDLERAAPALPPADWRPLLAPGCRVSVPSWDGRAGVQIVKTAVTVAAGAYDVVIDFGGEARLRVDGAPFWRHGDEAHYGPRISRRRLALASGTHQIEVRVGSSGGKTELGLWVLGPARSPARFVDPRAAVAAAPAPASPAAGGGDAGGPDGAASQTVPAPPGAADAGGELAELVRLYAGALIADRLGETDRALMLGEALARRRRFAPGLALAAAIARADPTQPAGFARDAGRALLRAAVAADPRMARAWRALAAIEIEAEHPRDAIDYAGEAARAAPRWWPPELALANALRARGLERDADQALDRAAEKAGPIAGAPCRVVEALLTRADEQRDLRIQDRLLERLSRCDPDAGLPIDRLRARGDLAGALAALRRSVALDPDRDELRLDLASVLLAKGERAEAVALLSALVAADPRDATLRVRLADAEATAGDRAAARATLALALQRRPDLSEVRRAARALGLPLPLDGLRLDGRQVIGAFQASRRRYAAPAVMILDRTVHRIFPDGAQLILTHNIVAVQTKDGIDKWGEVTVPAGAEVLMLRTHKRDGSTREPEEIAGKETISAPDLAVGDYVEWETLESKGASDAFAPGPLPGFLGDRFYFQSFDAPLDRSEYLVVTPRGVKLDVDRRAGAPAPVTRAALDSAEQPIAVTTFAAREATQLFAERASVPAIEYVPSVRVSSGVSWDGWSRFLREQLYGSWRSSPALRLLAAKLGAASKEPRSRAPALVRWVTDNIEAADDLRDPASFTLARGRGNRLALVLALARELGVAAEPQLARSLMLSEVDGPLLPQEVDDFGDTLIRFAPGAGDGAGDQATFVDPRLRHAPFGYLPPGLDGARTLSLADGRFGVARGRGSADRRTVDMTLNLDEHGGGSGRATEELTGWPALEWAELLDRFGSDQTKLRQDFEQRLLGVQFPGAHLDELQVDLASPGAPASVAATGASSGGDARVRVRYSFKSPQLGVVNDRELKLLPTFFRSQPGRRFATESRRSTTLMLGFDVPFRLTATVVLPPTARLVEAAPARAGLVARKGAYRFFEERSSPPGSPGILVLKRESSLPLSRVPPAEYAGVAADLRRVDGLEQQEIRIRLPGGALRGAGAP